MIFLVVVSNSKTFPEDQPVEEITFNKTGILFRNNEARRALIEFLNCSPDRDEGVLLLACADARLIACLFLLSLPVKKFGKNFSSSRKRSVLFSHAATEYS